MNIIKKIPEALCGILHILSAITWIGSLIYSEFAIKPTLKPLGPIKAHAVDNIATKNFSVFIWTSLVFLIITGSYKVYLCQTKFIPFLSKPSGVILTFKLILVVLLILILFFQRYVYGTPMNVFFKSRDQESQTKITNASYITTVLSKIALSVGVVVIILSVVLSGLLNES